MRNVRRIASFQPRSRQRVSLHSACSHALGVLHDNINVSADDYEIRLHAIYALAEIGSAAKAAVPTLIDALGDKSVLVQEQAAIALGKIGPIAVPALVMAQRHNNQTIRSWATKTIATIGAAGIPVLIDAIRNEDDSFRQDAAGAVQRMWRVAMPELVSGLRNQDIGIRQATQQLVRAIGPDAVQVMEALQNGPNSISTLIKALRHPERYIQSWAIKAVALIGIPGIPAILEAMRNEDDLFRQDAALAVLRMGHDAMPELVAGLRSQDAGIRQSAQELINAFGPAATRVVALALSEAAESTESTGSVQTAVREHELYLYKEHLDNLKIFYLIFRAYAEGCDSIRSACKAYESIVSMNLSRMICRVSAMRPKWPNESICSIGNLRRRCLINQR